MGDKIKFKPLIKSFINWTSVVVPNKPHGNGTVTPGGNDKPASGPTVIIKTNPIWYTGPQIGGQGKPGGNTAQVLWVLVVEFLVLEVIWVLAVVANMVLLEDLIMVMVLPKEVNQFQIRN